MPTAQYKLYASRWIRKYLILDNAKLLGSAFTDSRLNYARLIWIFCHKTTYLKMQKTHLKTFWRLLWWSTAIKQQRVPSLKTLVVCIDGNIQSTGTLHPQFMWSYLKYREVPYNLRQGPVVFIPPWGVQLMVLTLCIFLGF